MPDINQREVLINRTEQLVLEIEDLNDALFANTIEWRPVLEEREQADRVRYLTRSLWSRIRELNGRLDLIYDSPQFAQTWTIGKLQQEIRSLDPNLMVRFDYDKHHYVDSFEFHSYRGWYHHLGIGTVTEPTDIERLSRELEHSLMVTYEGYRGGTYFMYPETPIWAAEEGSSGARAITGLTVTDSLVIINTAEYQHDYNKD